MKDREELPRGVRNNNPLNVKDAKGNDWYGQIGVDDDGFVICEFPWQGYRMAAVLLKNYQEHHLAADGSRIDTVAEIVARWAPRVPSGTENPHQAEYIAFVRRKMGIEKGAHIDCGCPKTVAALLGAMAWFETGMEKPFPNNAKAIARGVEEAGIGKDSESTARAQGKDLRKVTAAGTAAAAAPFALPFGIGELGAAWPFATRLIELAPWLIAAGVGAVALYVGYRLWRKHAQGV